MSEVPGTVKAETSQSALDDFEVANVVQKVGCPRGIWVAALGRRRVSIGPIGVSSTIGAIKGVLLDVDGNHLLSTICGVIAFLVRAHF